MIIVISGPGGVGKGTVVAELMRRDPSLWLSRSWTTRDRRPGEAHDAYVFATPDEFDAQIAADGFLEWVQFLDYRQGSPIPDPPAGADVVFEVDTVGAAAIRERFPGALMILLEAPSREVQEQRMVGRGDAPEKIAARLARSDAEAEHALSLGSNWVVNDVLERTVDEVQRIIDEHRAAIPDGESPTANG